MIGEVAALATALCWTATSTFFALAGQRVGSVVVNRTRLVLAVLFLVPAHWLLQGEPLPLNVAAWRWGWLALSGLIGLAFGDAFLFQAFVWIGPRLSMLLMSLSPVVATLVAWAFLGETLSAWQGVGLALTVGGVAAVVLAREGRPVTLGAERTFLLGIGFGLLAATSQALGLITAKKGLGTEVSALSGTLIRMLVATGAIWAVTALRGQVGPTVARLRAVPAARWHILGGAFFGPFLGVTLSLVAVQWTAVGIASTLMALPPVFLLPIGVYVFRERVGPRAVIGTAVAILGVAVLFLV